MRIIELNLENFRLFNDRTIRFGEESPVTILIGENGTGKSAVLDALRVALGFGLSALLGRSTVVAREEDVRVRRQRLGDVVNAERQYPMQIHMLARIADEPVDIEVNLSEGPNGAELGPYERRSDIAQHLAAQLRQGEPVVLPLVAAYGTDRAETTTASPSAKRSASRRDGYQRALLAGSDASAFADWLRQRTGAALQTGRPASDMDAVTDALRHALPKYDGVRYDFTEGELLATRKDGSESTFSELSSGQRALLGTFCDIAYRCVVLNPHLGAAACTETSGVLLIDEIDLHLHPEWQRDVVGSLLTSFPRLHIIATTHSPFVVQSLPAHAVIDLSDEDANELPHGENYRKYSIEDIAEETMGVRNPQWSRARQRLAAAAERYYTLIADRNGAAADESVIADAKRELDEASIPFSADTAFAIYRSMREP